MTRPRSPWAGCAVRGEGRRGRKPRHWIANAGGGEGTPGSGLGGMKRAGTRNPGGAIVSVGLTGVGCSTDFGGALTAAPGAADGQRPPAGDGPGTGAGLRGVGDGGEQPAQLDRGRELAALLEDGTDRGGLSFGDDEHAGRMGARTEGGKLAITVFRSALVNAILLGAGGAHQVQGGVRGEHVMIASMTTAIRCSARCAT